MSTSVVTTLAECESVIERGLATFVEVGRALMQIRDERLYRQSHGGEYSTFEDYCRERWGFKRSYAYEVMQAAESAQLVSGIPDIPAPGNAGVAAELAPLRKNPDELRETWTEVVEQYGEKPTAAQVREVVNQLRPSGPTVMPPQEARPTNAMAVHYSSATDEWATPQAFFDVVNAEFQFDLDVCALDSSAKCERYFTPADDGLGKDWTGTCWMNPPYGDAIVEWVRKAAESAAAGATVVALVPARVDTGWWWDYCRHAEIRFLRGRLRFGAGAAGAPFPSALVIFGRAPKVVWWEWR